MTQGERKIAAICAAAWMMFVADVSYPQQAYPVPPTDVDLKASYCIAVQQSFLNYVNQAWPNLDTSTPDIDVERVTYLRKAKNEAADKLKHLQLYLVPRMQFVDASGLMAAHARALQDEKLTKAADVIECVDRCTGSSSNQARDTAVSKDCVRACAPESYTRLWACSDLSWLPF